MQQHLPSWPKDARPEDAVTTLVVAPRHVGDPGSCSFNTTSVPWHADLISPAQPACNDSADDAFASMNGLSVVKPTPSEQETLAALLSGLVEALSRPMSSISGAQECTRETISQSKASLRVGPFVQRENGLRVSWIEAVSHETGESVLPDMLWIVGDLPSSVLNRRNGCVVERFSDGVARLNLEFSADGSGELSMSPWIPSTCADEALRNMGASIRSRGGFGPSILHSMLSDAVAALLREDGISLPARKSLAKLNRGLHLNTSRVWHSTDGEIGYEFSAVLRLDRDVELPLGRFEARFGETDGNGFALCSVKQLPR